MREWGRRQGGVDTNRSFVSLCFLSCETSGGISVDFFSFLPTPIPGLSRENPSDQRLDANAGRTR